MVTSTQALFSLLIAISFAMGILLDVHGGMTGNQYSVLDQGRITYMNWGYMSFSFSSVYGAFMIRNWNSDGKSSTQEVFGTASFFAACVSLNVDSDDYITGYKVYHSNYIYGLQFFTLNGQTYSCNSPEISGKSISTWRNDSYYLSGWRIGAGEIIDGIQFQFTTIPTTIPPTMFPTEVPTKFPSQEPTDFPSQKPTEFPSTPSQEPTKFPSQEPTKFPSQEPTYFPSQEPTKFPSTASQEPTKFPSQEPTKFPSTASHEPTKFPSQEPTDLPSNVPSDHPMVGESIRATSPPTLEHAGEAVDSSRSTSDVDSSLDTPSLKDKVTDRDIFTLVLWSVFIALMSCILCACVYRFQRRKVFKDTTDNLSKPAEIKDTEMKVVAVEPLNIISWLRDVVQLPQYSEQFIGKGYYTLEAVMSIGGQVELKAIGIDDPQHQIWIMKQIDALKNNLKVNVNPGDGRVIGALDDEERHDKGSESDGLGDPESAVMPGSVVMPGSNAIDGNDEDDEGLWDIQQPRASKHTATETATKTTEENRDV